MSKYTIIMIQNIGERRHKSSEIDMILQRFFNKHTGCRREWGYTFPIIRDDYYKFRIFIQSNINSMDKIRIHGKSGIFYLLKYSFTGNSWRKCSTKIRSNPGKRSNGVLKLHNPIQEKGWGEEKEKRSKVKSRKGDNSTKVT